MHQALLCSQKHSQYGIFVPSFLGKCSDNMLLFYRADEWDINKWAWDGVLKVVSKGEECIIRLEDKTTGTVF